MVASRQLRLETDSLRMFTEPRVFAVLSVCALGAILALGSLEREPPASDESDRATAFSTSRALADLEWIAKEPHPMGSIANREVRRRLVSRLEEIGLEVRVDGGFVAPHGVRPEHARVDWVENVVARLPGSDDSRALLIASHYDSAGTAPGAGDDGAAVAAMIEVARGLVSRVKDGRPFVNDVIFLFTDGEEIELLGARHHVAAGTWREKTAAVLNFEARGASGPSILFETSEGNSRLVDAFAAVVQRPVASSLAYEVYRRMPNDTDFSIFRRAGWRGLNFAFIGSHERYHTAGDSLENLDPRSLAHHGATMLALASHLADEDLGEVARDDATAVFFGVLGRSTISYPLAFQYLVNVLALALVAAALVVAFRRERIGRSSLLAGVAAQAIALLASCAVSAILVRFVTGVDESDRVTFWRVVNDGPRHLPAHLLLAASIVTFTLLQMRSRTGADGAYAGALVVSSLALAAATVIAPAGSYVFAWPLLCAALAFLVFVTRPRKGRVDAARFAILVVSLVPTGLVVVPILYFAGQALTFAAAPVVIAAFVLALAPATPLLLSAMAVSRLLIPIATAVIAWSLLGWAVWDGSLSDETPRASRVEYVVDGSTGAASFACAEGDELRAMFPGAVVTEVEAEALIPHSGKALRSRIAANSEPVAEATFEWMGATIEGEVRTCEFRLRVPEGTSSVRVRISRESRAWIESVAGIESNPELRARDATAQRGNVEKDWSSCEIRIRGVPRDAVIVRVAQPIAIPLVATIVTRTYGLPPLPFGATAPSAWRIPASWSADETVIHRTLQY